MISDATMWKSLGNTFLYVLLIVPTTVFLALILAQMLNTGIKGRGFFRVIYFIPTVTMSVAVAMMWRWIFNGDFGIFNYVITMFGGTPQYWLSDPKTAILCISVVSVWMSVGLNMIILLAGIQGIPAHFYEAARLDGASKTRQFFNITIPLVTPTLFFVVITTMISTLQIFDVIYMMIAPKSAALNETQSVVVYFFRNAFEYSKKGYASAIAVFLFVIILVITALQMRLQKKWVNYD
jgi:multiple sugar transport system permease protein